jgi:hypothetical protein
VLFSWLSAILYTQLVLPVLWLPLPVLIVYIHPSHAILSTFFSFNSQLHVAQNASLDVF